MANEAEEVQRKEFHLRGYEKAHEESRLPQMVNTQEILRRSFSGIMKILIADASGARKLSDAERYELELLTAQPEEPFKIDIEASTEASKAWFAATMTMGDTIQSLKSFHDRRTSWREALLFSAGFQRKKMFRDAAEKFADIQSFAENTWLTSMNDYSDERKDKIIRRVAESLLPIWCQAGNVLPCGKPGSEDYDDSVIKFRDKVYEFAKKIDSNTADFVKGELPPALENIAKQDPELGEMIKTYSVIVSDLQYDIPMRRDEAVILAQLINAKDQTITTPGADLYSRKLTKAWVLAIAATPVIPLSEENIMLSAGFDPSVSADREQSQEAKISHKNALYIAQRSKEKQFRDDILAHPENVDTFLKSIPPIISVSFRRGIGVSFDNPRALQPNPAGLVQERELVKKARGIFESRMRLKEALARAEYVEQVGKYINEAMYAHLDYVQGRLSQEDYMKVLIKNADYYNSLSPKYQEEITMVIKNLRFALGPGALGNYASRINPEDREKLFSVLTKYGYLLIDLPLTPREKEFDQRNAWRARAQESVERKRMPSQ